MGKDQTLRILNALANGVHPATGEKFAADSPYQHPDTVRALFEAMRAMEGLSPDEAQRRVNKTTLASVVKDLKGGLLNVAEHVADVERLLRGL